MAVVITTKPAFWAPGFLIIPDDEKTLTFEFKARFKRLPAERSRELIALIEESRRASALGKKPPLTDKALLDEVMCDWGGFKDADGAPVPYTPANRAQAVEDWFGLEAAFTRAFIEAAWPEQRRKEAEKN